MKIEYKETLQYILNDIEHQLRLIDYLDELPARTLNQISYSEGSRETLLDLKRKINKMGLR